MNHELDQNIGDLDKENRSARVLAKNYIDKALKLSKEYSLLDRIGLENDGDRDTFSIHLAKRLLRTSVYDASFLLSHPVISVAAKIPGILRMIKIIDKIYDKEIKALNYLDLMDKRNTELNYSNIEERNRGRMIELSVNDLVAQSSVENESRTTTSIEFREEILTQWGEKWKEKLQA